MNERDTASSPAGTLIGLGRPLPPAASWHSPGVDLSALDAEDSPESDAPVVTRPRNERPVRDSFPDAALPLKSLISRRIWGFGVATASLAVAAFAARGMLPVRRAAPRPAAVATARLPDLTTRVVGGPWVVRSEEDASAETVLANDVMLEGTLSAVSVVETPRKKSRRHRHAKDVAAIAMESAPAASSAVPAEPTAGVNGARVQSISEGVRLDEDQDPAPDTDSN